MGATDLFYLKIKFYAPKTGKTRRLELLVAHPVPLVANSLAHVETLAAPA